MLAEKRIKTNIGIAVGILLQIGARFLFRGENASGGLAYLGFSVALVGAAFWVWGCMNYAEGKGHSKWLGLLGLLSCIGLIILVLMPDRHKEAR